MLSILPASYADQPTFMDIAQCPLYATRLITNMRIDQTKIHNCTSSLESVYDSTDKIEVVNISYDDPENCATSCQYKNYSAVVEGVDTNARFTEVPPKDLTNLPPKDLPNYPTKSTRKDFICQSYNIDELIKKSYGKKFSDWGMYIELTNPFTCTWIEPITSTDGQKIKGIWTGLMFVRKQNVLEKISEIKYREEKTN
jgi:hypothetical protein